MKSMKRIASVVLAMVMVLAMSMPVMAAGITIKNDKTGHKYEAYQIFKGDMAIRDGHQYLSNVEWGEGITEAGQSALKEYFEVEDIDELLEKLSEVKTEEAQKIAELLNGYLQNPKDFTEGTGEYTLNGIDSGYYLIKDKDDSLNGKADAYTSYMMRVFGLEEVTPKSDVPTSEKKVKDINDSTDTDYTNWQDSADHDIGDMVDFQLKGTLPSNFTDYEKYKLVFHDQESAGLTFEPSSVKVYVGNSEEAVDGTLYDVVYPATDGHTFDVEIPNVKALAGVDNGVEIRVEYQSKLNDDAVIGAAGNPNTMYMEYSNNPNVSGDGDNDDTGTTPEDTVIVFTYKTVIDKVDEEGAPLEGAEFTLYKKDEDNPDAITEGVYKGYVAKAMVKANNAEQFTFNGLDDGEYILVESKTPAGYNTMEDIHFTVAATHDEKADKPELKGLTVTVTDGSGFEFTADKDAGNVQKQDKSSHERGSGEIYAEVINHRGTVLPETGGIGTTIFYVVGAILVIGAGVLLVARKRMNREQ